MIEIPKHELFERIGKGGMGEVWMARDERTRKSRAIKVLLASKARSEYELFELANRFRREAAVLMALRSPHTVRVYDWGQLRDGDSLWLAMDLLDGVDLETLVTKHGPLPHGRAIYLLRQVCESLHEAHDQDLIHRDLKPANIFVCQYPSPGHVVVVDFGLARETTVSDLGGLTSSGATLGTPCYMAPEQIAGKKELDGRADIYSLGCVAYRVLTGQIVLAGEGQWAWVLAHTNEHPPAPSTVVPSIPPELDALVLRCLAKNPQDRPASAAEVAEELAKCPGAEDWSQREAAAWWAGHPAPRRLLPTPVDPLATVLASFPGLSALVDFLWRDLQPPEEGAEIKKLVDEASSLEEAAEIGARELRSRSLLGRELYGLLREKVPSRQAEIDALAERQANLMLGLSANQTSRSFAPAPLPEARHHMGRMLQWLDLVERSRSERHEVFLLHGPENQYLGDFTERVRYYLNDELRRRGGGLQGLRVVSADRDADGSPHLAAIWKKRFAAKVGPGLGPALAVEEAARYEPLLVVFGREPQNPPIRTRVRDFDALLEFLSAGLPAIVREARPANKVRFYLALEHEDEDPSTPTPDSALARMASALTTLAASIGSSFSLTPPVSFPTFGDIEAYVKLLRREPSQQWWTLLRRRYEHHRIRGRDFRQLCRDLDALLRQHDEGGSP